MFEKLQIVKMAQQMAAHAGARQGIVSQNIANADTPGYKAQDLPDFAATFRNEGALKATRAGHIGVAGHSLTDLGRRRTSPGVAGKLPEAGPKSRRSERPKDKSFPGRMR